VPLKGTIKPSNQLIYIKKEKNNKSADKPLHATKVLGN